jgi:hypothetical protein
VKTCRRVDEYVVDRGASYQDPSHRHKWVATGTTCFQPVSGTASSKTNVAGACKPDVVLVGDDVSNHQSSDVISVIDVKYRYNSKLLRKSKEYMMEISRLVFTNQVDRRFFVGTLLTGPEMRIGVFTRGSAAFYVPIDIYADPVKYM